MKSAFKKQPGSLIHLEVDLTSEEFQEYWDRNFNEQLEKVQLKGFRPGQAPKELAAKAVDPEKVFETAANEAIRQTLNELTEEHHWTVIDQPKVAVTPKERGLNYTVDLTVFPEVVLGDYKKIARQITTETKTVIEKLKVAPEEVEKACDWLKKQGANLENFKTDEALKKSVEEGILMEKKEHEREKGRIKMVDSIVKVSQMDIPQIMIDRTKTQGLTDEQAKKNITGHLIMYKIAQIENLNPTPAEVEEELKHYASRGQKIDNQKAYDYIYGALQSKKVFEFLEGV